MSTSFTLTRNQIAQRVLGQVIALEGSTSATTAEYNVVYQAIDLRLKEWHKLGVVARKVPTVPLTFSIDVSVNSASATADILFPLRVTFSDGDNDLPVDIINPLQYAAITDKTEIGDVQKVVWNRNATFTLWPVPSANGTLKLTYEKIADDTTAGTAVDIDVSMLRNMINILKYDIADDFGIEEAKQARWERAALMSEREIRKINSERVDYEPVKVDNFTDRTVDETDYNS